MKKGYIILIIVVVVLLIIRISLPFIVKGQINKQIDALEGYSGEVEGVSLRLITGGIQVHDFTLFNEISIDPSDPFITLDHGDVSIFWRELFKGRVVVNVIFDKLHISFTKYDDDIPEEEMDAIPLDSLLKEFIPFRINLFRITNSKIGYKDITSSPEVDIYLSDFFFEVTNIQNIERSNDTLPATLKIQTSAMNSGSITMDAGLNLMKDIPDFEYTLEIENIDLTHFDPFLEAYANLNLNKGLLELYSESAAHDGYLSGYVKPLIENLDIIPVNDDANIIRKGYEAILQGIVNLFENNDTEHIGTRVTFDGRIDNPDVDIWNAIWQLLGNAFFESISLDLDDTIDFDNLI